MKIVGDEECVLLPDACVNLNGGDDCEFLVNKIFTMSYERITERPDTKLKNLLGQLFELFEV